MYSIQEKVTTSYTDKNGNLKLFSAFQMLQDCSELWLDSEPTTKRYLEENGMCQLLASRQVNIVRIPQYKENLTISTSIYECKELFGFRNTIISDEEGNPCYVTWSMGAFVNRNSGKLSKLSQTVLDSIHYEPKFEMDYKERRIRIPQTEATFFPPIAVSRNDIDYNLHMNNAQYIRIAMELIPENSDIKSIRVEYKKPLHEGELLFPKMYKQNDNVIVVLSDDTTICTIVDFVLSNPYQPDIK